MILFFCSILVVPLVLMLGALTVDLPVLFRERVRAQAAADSAAVAGASSTTWLPDDPACVGPSCPGTWQVNPDVPKAYSALNGYPSPTVTTNLTTPSVRVVISTSTETVFARLIGLNRLSTTVVAEAIRRNIEEAQRLDPGRSALTQ